MVENPGSRQQRTSALKLILLRNWFSSISGQAETGVVVLGPAVFAGHSQAELLRGRQPESFLQSFEAGQYLWDVGDGFGIWRDVELEREEVILAGLEQVHSAAHGPSAVGDGLRQS